MDSKVLWPSRADPRARTGCAVRLGAKTLAVPARLPQQRRFFGETLLSFHFKPFDVLGFFILFFLPPNLRDHARAR